MISTDLTLHVLVELTIHNHLLPIRSDLGYSCRHHPDHLDHYSPDYPRARPFRAASRRTHPHHIDCPNAIISKRPSIKSFITANPSLLSIASGRYHPDIRFISPAQCKEYCWHGWSCHWRGFKSKCDFVLINGACFLVYTSTNLFTAE